MVLKAEQAVVWAKRSDIETCSTSRAKAKTQRVPRTSIRGPAMTAQSGSAEITYSVFRVSLGVTLVPKVRPMMSAISPER